MRNPLQEQLLKAGLVKKDKAAKIVRDQAKQRQGKAPPTPAEEKVNAQKLQSQRAERDRTMSAQRNAEARTKELQAQIRQIVETKRVRREGDIAYRFPDGEKIASILVDDSQRTRLASGVLAIARFGDGYELVPRPAADKIHERDPQAMVLDHGRGENAPPPSDDDDDDYYKQFVVPDDLTW